MNTLALQVKKAKEQIGHGMLLYSLRHLQTF